MAQNFDLGINFDAGRFNSQAGSANPSTFGMGGDGGFDLEKILQSIPGIGSFATGKGIELLGGLVSSIFGGGAKKRAKKRLRGAEGELTDLGEEDFLNPFAIAGFARKESRIELKDAASKLANLSGGQLSDFDLFGALRESQADTLGLELAGLEERNQALTSGRRTNIALAKYKGALQTYLNA